MESDREVIEKVISGDTKAFESIIQRYKNILFRYVLSHIPNFDIAEELTQDVFIKFYFSIDKFRFESSLITYLYKIARNLCIDIKRKKNINEIYLEEIQPEPKGQSAEFEIEQKFWLLQILSKISDEQRSAIEMFYVEGFKYREIAEILELPMGTVKSRLKRGIEKLRKIIKEAK